MIIGLAGTLSSGKDTIAHHLEREKGFFHCSTSDMLRAEKARIYGDTPEALLRRADPFANKLRAEKGPGILVQLAYEAFENSNAKNLVISGIRSIGEVEKLHELGGVLLFVDADKEVRYKRVCSRGRDSQDSISFEEFLAQEAVESEGIDPKDKTIQNLPAMKQMADHVMYNNSDLEAFLLATDQILFKS
jgi:dephospho-CoA kinase